MASQIHLRKYFDRFPEFNYDESKETIAQFHRLAKQKHWDEDERKDERKALQTALVLQFNDTYGKEETDIQGWQKLCHAIDVDPIPGSVAECKKLFKTIHVNLVDLVDAQGTGAHVATYPTEVALAKYTKKTRKIFPRENAQAGGLLKFLLRQIMRPRTGVARKRPSRSQRGLSCVALDL